MWKWNTAPIAQGEGPEGAKSCGPTKRLTVSKRHAFYPSEFCLLVFDLLIILIIRFVENL